MNKDEIIDMANKAGFDLTMWQLSLGCEVSGTHDELLAFAKLVAEAEREACAKVCDVKAIRYAERGALPEKLRDIDPKNAVVATQVCGHVAYEIRLRGQNETKSYSPHEIL